MSSCTIRPRLLIIQEGKCIDGHIGKLLEEKNCQVEATDNLDKGIRMINTLQFDAVVLDLDTSSLDTSSRDNRFFQFVKGYKAGPPLILVGDSSHERVNEKGLSYQIHDYIVRPVSDFDLSNVIQGLIDRKALLEENRLLKKRLEVLEKNTADLFSKLEDRVMTNTREIAQKKEILQKIFNQIDGEIVLADKNYNIIQANNIRTVNGRAEQAVGESAEQEQTVGENYIGIGGLQDDTEDRPGCLAMKTGKAVSMEKVVFEDKPRYIRQTAFPLFDGSVEEVWGFVQFNQEITEERLNRERLIQSEKIKVIEKLAAFFSCNLQTLSMTAHNTIDRLRKELRKKDTGLRDFLQLLDDQIIRADEYITDLLLVLNKESGNVPLVNVNDIIQVNLNSNKLLKRSEGIKVVFEQKRDLALIRINRFHLARVFTHLINNALDSMPSGGELKIITRRKGSEVEIEFSDTGAGVPEDIRLKIFEPFFSTKLNRPGLGLYVCKSVLEKYRGELTLRSDKTPDQSTSFIINMPSQVSDEQLTCRV